MNVSIGESIVMIVVKMKWNVFKRYKVGNGRVESSGLDWIGLDGWLSHVCCVVCWNNWFDDVKN